MIINLNKTTDLKTAKKISEDLEGKLIFDEIASRDNYNYVSDKKSIWKIPYGKNPYGKNPYG